MSARCFIAVLAVACVFAGSPCPAAGPAPADAEKVFKDGNFKEAYEQFAALARDPATPPKQAGAHLRRAVECLGRLNRSDEIDAFTEAVIAAHAGQWRLLALAAQVYRDVEHYGYLVAGDFLRGAHRGGGLYRQSWERDRVRGMQLLDQALRLAADDPKRDEVAELCLQYADMLARGGETAWRLQYLTDLAELPDYEEGYRYGYGGEAVGAPVDRENNPVFHHVPSSYEAAASDGERWRWLLRRAAELDPRRTHDALRREADFLQQQFGVHTLGDDMRRLAIRDENQADDPAANPFAVHTLGEDETIARLATGARRFTLDPEFSFIRLYRRIADEPDTGQGEAALAALAQIFTNRRQYGTAAEIWGRSIREYGPGPNDHKKKRLSQIVDNWGRFESVTSQVAGKGATVEYVFRNGSQVHFEAHAIDVKTLLGDLREYLKSKPKTLDWERLQIPHIGHTLISGRGARYLLEKVAEWDLDLAPAPGHMDRRLTVTTPLQRPGAYWLTATMKNGNRNHIVLWVDDTILVKKPLRDGVLVLAADARTGAPVANANVEFFGYRQQYIHSGKLGHYDVETRNFAEFTDADGQVLLAAGDVPENHRWIITATTPEGRFAFLGFSNIWRADYHDSAYEATRVYSITDRPVYRPGQTVHFKCWVAHAQYDQDDGSAFAGKGFKIEVRNPKGDVILERSLTADAYGGIEGEFALAGDAALGSYGVQVVDHGGGTFRVEEYRKPEFAVTIDSPAEPVALGETVHATVRAAYYFGAPVTKAKVKLKVTRSDHDAAWYPSRPWDWLYGRGYGWFASDYTWYPGWGRWGCPRPVMPWYPRFMPRHPPEVVLQHEAPLGADGTLAVDIDTALAKAVYGDRDHAYTITAEVVDESRRTIVGSGRVLATRAPYKVHAWVDRGHYRAGDTVRASFSARSADDKPVAGAAAITLFSVRYDAEGRPTERREESWEAVPDAEGGFQVQMVASRAGQYRVACEVTDAAGRREEGACLFTVGGDDFNGESFRFNALELLPERAEYKPGEAARVMINTDRRDSAVWLFVRPADGVYLPPRLLRLGGKSAVEEIAVTLKDMPNFFVEAVTVSDGKVHTEVRELAVPPEKRIINVDVLPSKNAFKPGEKGRIAVRLTDLAGKPFVGSLVMTVYDKALEYIAGGSNVPEIRAFFWKWRRRHSVRDEHTAERNSVPLNPGGAAPMQALGVFGALTDGAGDGSFRKDAGFGGSPPRSMRRSAAMPAMAAAKGLGADKEQQNAMEVAASGDAVAIEEPTTMVEPAVRKDFADTALWVAALETDASGLAETDITMPENLTGWKIRAWAMGHGTKVGEGAAEVVTTKNLLLRLQAPRFLIEKDEVVLSANIHNYLPTEKEVRAVLELDGKTLVAQGDTAQTVRIPAGGAQRVDWRAAVKREGLAVVRMKALTDEESDAMEVSVPVHVHGLLRVESWSGALRGDETAATLEIRVPEERRPEQTRLEIRYSPTLAGAMVDALPYLADYPYGCTEQTLNRFLPAVLTQKTLLRMGLDLAAIRDKRTNLNAQELGDGGERAAQWKRRDENPVFDNREIDRMVKAGLEQLASMQLADGGWGWFSGWSERASGHNTATVVHGLQLARENGVAIVPDVLERGIAWLQRHQDEQIRRLENADGEKKPWKKRADELDALVYRVLVDEKIDDARMRAFLYRDRSDLAVYAKCLFGMALARGSHEEMLAMVMRNIDQYLVEDEENQTAWLNLDSGGCWWFWYGSEYEAQACYLTLLSMKEPQGRKASRLVKYLVNNRKHATYWNSTRDTALCVEALAAYIKASGEDAPDMEVEILVDGESRRRVAIQASNLFTFDNALVLEGAALASGRHVIDVRRTGKGPLYFNASLANFTLEDPIRPAGLEVKVERRLFRLRESDRTQKARGASGQAVDSKVEAFQREALGDRAELKSGDLVEIELVIESKNDYEYIVIEDRKAAGLEPVDLRSGYTGNALGAYVEFRDERVVFFVRQLMRGRHSVTYRLRAETPGLFSALPATISAMYAPELKGNAAEQKVRVVD